MKKTKIFLLALLSLVFILSAHALAYRDVYVDEVGVDFNLSPSNNAEMNYLPLQEIAEYYGISLNFDEDDKEIHCVWNKTRFLLKLGSRIVEVKGKREVLENPIFKINGHIMVPIDFFEDLLKIDFNWRNPTPIIIVRPISFQNSVKVYLYTNMESYDFGDQIVVTLIIKNTSMQTLKIPLRSSQVYDLTLSYKNHELWSWSKDKMFLTAISNYMLEPGESKIYNITLPKDLILTPAQYQLVGSFAAKPEVNSDTTYFYVTN
ncbi:MAG: hypothetical protein KAX49_02535 [Halanaerobiales bacterium]|nr:hypothetical protein [Halanaerobiales bacterium]